MNLFLFKKQICFLYINLIQIIKTYEKQSNSKRKKNLFLDLREWLYNSFENLLYKFCHGKNWWNINFDIRHDKNDTFVCICTKKLHKFFCCLVVFFFNHSEPIF